MKATRKEEELKILTCVLDETVRNGKTKYGPVYICGDKSETAQIIPDFVLRYKQAFPASTVIRYIGNSLIDSFIAKVKSGEDWSAKEEFGNTDLLILENVDFIGGKTFSMEMLFSAVDVVEQSGGQIIYTSDRLPCEITALDDRNRTQFEGGLIVNLRDE